MFSALIQRRLALKVHVSFDTWYIPLGDVFVILIFKVSYISGSKYCSNFLTLYMYFLDNCRSSSEVLICSIILLVVIMISLDWRHITCLKTFIINSKFIQITFSYILRFKFKKKSLLSLGLLNPGSLGTRHDEFLIAMEHHSVDIMAINETWIRDGEEKKAPMPPGYRLRHIPRPAGERVRGGGVGFYLKRGVSARLLAHPVAPAVEQMWLGLTLNGIKLAVGTAYRPPWQNTDNFINAISDSMSHLSSFDQVILMGDFNIDMLKVQDVNTKKLNNFLYCQHLTQYVDRATHFTGHSETLIDVICSSLSVTDLCIDHIPELSSHAFVSFKVKINKAKIPPRLIIYRPLKDVNFESFQSNLDHIEWERVLSGDVSNSVITFNAFLLNLFDRHAPVKFSVVKEYSFPWITYNIKKMVAKRNEAHSRYKRSGSEAHRMYYKDMKKIVIDAIQNEKSAYFNKYIVSQVKNPRGLWKHIKLNVADFNKKNVDIPHYLWDPNGMNDFFLNLPGENRTRLSDLTYYEFHRYSDAQFTLKPVTEFAVDKVIKSISTQAQGSDGISLDMLLMTLPRTLSTITAIVNQSIDLGVFPEPWKNAVVKPIPKVSSPAEFKDLRPISILPLMSKILERVVCMQ